MASVTVHLSQMPVFSYCSWQGLSRVSRRPFIAGGLYGYPIPLQPGQKPPSPVRIPGGHTRSVFAISFALGRAVDPASASPSAPQGSANAATDDSHPSSHSEGPDTASPPVDGNSAAGQENASPLEITSADAHCDAAPLGDAGSAADANIRRLTGGDRAESTQTSQHAEVHSTAEVSDPTAGGTLSSVPNGHLSAQSQPSVGDDSGATALQMMTTSMDRSVIRWAVRLPLEESAWKTAKARRP